MKAKIIAFIQEYKHSLLILYGLVYIPWFTYLEQSVTTHFNVIHLVIDDYIPFIEYFIVPYMLWFLYVAAGVAYFFFRNKAEYYKLCIFLITGMTVFLVISTIYPNGTYLRPVVFERDNIFVDAVKWLYSTDTPTNLFPSIHVYNSLAIHIAISKNENLKNNKLVLHASRIMMSSIILATVFLKQHSLFDVITAFALAGLMYVLLYTPAWVRDLMQPDRTSKEIKM
jgi:membrane-associated phospholipid phosphatase